MKKIRILSILLAVVMVLTMMPTEIFAAPKAPARVKAKAVVATYNSNKLSWKEIRGGVSGYEVHRATSKNGKYKRIKSLTSAKKVTFTNKKLKTGQTYFYKVRAYRTVKGKRVYGKFSKVVKAKPVLKRAAATATPATRNSNKVNWGRVAGASGYEVHRATSKNGKYKRVKRVTSGKAGSFTDKKLTTGRSYFYKVRAYRTVSGKRVYGKYSQVVSAKPAQPTQAPRPTATPIPKPTATQAPKPTAVPVPTVTPVPEPVEKLEIGKVWMMPGASSFNEFLNNPAGLDGWTYTQSKVDIIGYADHDIMKRNSAEDRIAGFAKLKEMGIGLGLEVGAVKEWAISGGGVDDDINSGGNLGIVGKMTFERQNELYWKQFIEEGADIKAFTLDEPFTNVMNHCGLPADRQNVDYGFDKSTAEGREEIFQYSMEQTAQFMEATRAEYPHIAIGVIEAMPSNFDADTLIRWSAALNARLEAGPSGRGMDFFRLDVDWNNNGKGMDFRKGNAATPGWKEVKRLEDWCKSVDLPFSMIYWGPNHDGYWVKDQTTDKAWYDQVMLQGAHYNAAVGGTPDQYVVQSWIRVDGVDLPYTNIPETSPKSFTNSFVDIYNTYIEPIKGDIDIDNPGDVSEWLNLTFDVTASGWDSNSQLLMEIESENGMRGYDVTKFVYGGTNKMVVQFDAFDYRTGRLDLTDIKDISFSFSGAGTYAVDNFSLITPKTAIGGDDDIDEEEGEIIELFDEETEKHDLPRTDSVHATLIHNQLLDERVNLEEWRFINFDIYVEDYAKLEASGNAVRLKIGSPTDAAITGDSGNEAYYHDPVAIYQFTSSVLNTMRRDGWVTLQIPVKGTIWQSLDFDFSQAITLWFYLETEGVMPIPETKMAVRNIYLSGKTDPPAVITVPEKPTADAGTLYLDEGNYRYDIDWPAVTPEMNTYTHWPALDSPEWNTWASGVAKPTDFSEYENIEFYFHIDDLSFFEDQTDADLILKLVSGNDIDANANLYGFKDQVLEQAGMGDNWYSITIPLDSPIANEGGTCDLTAVTGMRLNIQKADAPKVETTLVYAYFRLTGKETTEEPETPDEPFVPVKPDAEEGEQYLMDTLAEKFVINPGDETNIFRYWPAEEQWPSGLAKPTKFSDYENIEFFFYIEDKTLLIDNPQVDLRLILASGAELDDGNIYSFRDQVREVAGLGSGWYAIKIPLNATPLAGSCDLDIVRGMQLKIQDEGVTISATVQYAYLRLTK